MLLALFSLLSARLVMTYAFASIPLPRQVELPSSSQVYDAQGRLIASYSDEVTRFLIDTDVLPKYVGRAVVAAEDHEFYEHQGVSLRGIARSAWENLTNRAVRQGGSTISQQYIKNAVLKDPSRTVERKLKEIILAIKLERRYTKREILGFYLNTVYFGRGAYGIEAAARAYFDKHARELDLGEAAYLAGIIPSPDSYQPDERPHAARRQRNRVLGTMRQLGYTSRARYLRALRGPVEEATGLGVSYRRAPAAYFLEWLRKEYLYPRFGDCLYRCGLRIFTTLDLDMQHAAERAVRSTLAGKKGPQAAVVSMTPRGEVRAFVGGRDFTSIPKSRGFNYASDGGRQAGSALKPFTLLAALESGISTESRFPGTSPQTIEDPVCSGPDGLWQPENYDGASYGTITLDEATANSVNTVYAQLIAEIGPERVAALLQRFGFRDRDRRRVIPHCSLALGAFDVSPLQMVRAYAALAGEGLMPRVSPITHVLDADGKCLIEYVHSKKRKCRRTAAADPRRVADANATRVLTQTLSGVVEGGTAASASIGRPQAGKTGTTQNHRDAWFAGYVPQLATVVWMGHPTSDGKDGRPGTADDFTPVMEYCGDTARCRPVQGIEVTGGSFPARIWAAFMAQAVQEMAVAFFTAPTDLPDTVLNPLPPPPPPAPPPSPDTTEAGPKKPKENGHPRGRRPN